MNVLEGLDGLRRLPAGAAVSIGNFDGVHAGHRAIVAELHRLRAAAPGGRGSVAVVTFEPHPLTVLKPEAAPPRLTPPAVKREVLAAIGVDHLVVLPPTPDVLETSAEAFWQILRDEARVAHLVEGDSFTFGKGRGGNVAKLKQWASGTGVGVHVVPQVFVTMADLQVAPVSSSLVRFLLATGRARDVAVCLNRPYVLEGPVVKGFQRGRTIGIPTANLDCGDQMIPTDGVYAARCTLDGVSYPVALSIGTLPTFGENKRQVEGYIVGFAGDLYGQTIRFELIDWLREQWKLPGIEALKTQIARDVESIVRTVRAIDPAKPVGVQ